MRTRRVDKNIQYVIPVGNAWAVKSADKIKFTLITESKREAIAFARQIAKTKETELIIYGKNGQILTTSSYNRKGKAIAKA